EDAAVVGVDDPVPIRLVVLRGRSCLRRQDPRIVEGEVQPPERLDGLVQSRLHVLGPRHVAPDGERPPALFLDHADRFLVALFRHVSHHHAGTLARERQRRRAADAARCPSHESDLPREVAVPFRRHIQFLSMLSRLAPSLRTLRSSVASTRGLSSAADLAQLISPAGPQPGATDVTQEHHGDALALARVDDGLAVARGFLQVEPAHIRLHAQDGCFAYPHAVENEFLPLTVSVPGSWTPARLAARTGPPMPNARSDTTRATAFMFLPRAAWRAVLGSPAAPPGLPSGPARSLGRPS